MVTETTPGVCAVSRFDFKPICTLGFIYRGQPIKRRPPMQPAQWAMMNKFDDAMLADKKHPVDLTQRMSLTQDTATRCF
jgi:hypothetical protein